MEDGSQWGYASSLGGQQNYYNLIKQNEGEILNADQTESMLGEPAACEALQFAGDFIADGLSPSVAVMQANDPHEMLFPAGVIAMIFGGIVECADLQPGQPGHRGSCRCRRARRRPRPSTAWQTSIWTGSQNQCAAMEWVKYLASADAERILGSTGTVIPAMQGLQEEWVSSLPNFDLQVFLDAVDYSFPVPNPKSGPEWANDVDADAHRGLERRHPPR